MRLHIYARLNSWTQCFVSNGSSDAAWNTRMPKAVANMLECGASADEVKEVLDQLYIRRPHLRPQPTHPQHVYTCVKPKPATVRSCSIQGRIKEDVVRALQQACPDLPADAITAAINAIVTSLDSVRADRPRPSIEALVDGAWRT